MVWKKDDPQGNEAGKIRWEIVKWTRGRGLDIGAGLYRTFPHFITVDNNIDAVLFGHPMPRPDIPVEDGAKLDCVASASMDFVFSSHMLEHVEEENLVKCLKEWMRVIKPKGYLVLYLPDADEYPKVGEPGANPDHKWNVTYLRVCDLMKKTGVGWDLVDFQKRNADNEYSLYFVFRKEHEGHAFSYDAPRPVGKTVGVVRYGAYGDLIQAASVCAALKREGWHVTLYTANPGYEVIQHDPNIDEFYIQDRDQVPNPALGEFWAYHAKKYDRWINLSETVEGALLTMAGPGRIVDTYPPAVRHQLCNRNYLEYQHLVAGVEYDPDDRSMKFYPTEQEKEWAKAERKAYGQFLIVWALSGSSVHKHWPHLDAAVSGLLIDFPEVEILFVGGKDGVVLEQGWEKAARVHRRSGKWDIRQTLSFVQLADVVIGSETGVLNAVAHSEMPKVVFLSHSTQENLTRDWENTHSLASVGTVCKGRGNDEAPACHQLHHGWARCTEAPAPPDTEHLYERKGSGVAQCMWDIGAQDAYKVIWHVVQWRLEEYAKRAGLPPPGVTHLTEEQMAALRQTLPGHVASPEQAIEALEE
jgi:predicted SAM-dependent methyltransferase/ADP-heptose:LPS heptosyltransferase